MKSKFLVKKLSENALLPFKGSKGAAGYDIHAYLDKFDRIDMKEDTK